MIIFLGLYEVANLMAFLYLVSSGVLTNSMANWTKWKSAISHYANYWIEEQFVKKLLVTYKVQDAEWWVQKNTLEQVFGPMGVNFQFFRKANTNLVGYIAEIKNEEIFEDILFNTTLLTTSMKVNGVLKETVEILELVGN